MSSNPEKRIADLLDRLEVKIAQGLDTPGYLNAVAQSLDELVEGKQDSLTAKAQQYTYELRVFIYGRQDADDLAQDCLGRAAVLAGSTKRLRSTTLRDVIKHDPKLASYVAAQIEKSEEKQKIVTKKLGKSSAKGFKDFSERDKNFLRKYSLTSLPDTEFFVRKPWQYVLLTIASFGFYGLYWETRNWQVIAHSTEKRIRPIWRAIFGIFFRWSLYRIIGLNAKARGYRQPYSGGLLALCSIVPGLVVSFASDPFSFSIKYYSSLPAVMLISLAVLYYVQRVAIHNNMHLTKKVKPYSARGKNEILLVVLAILIMTPQFYLLIKTPKNYLTPPWTRISQINTAYKDARAATQQLNICVADLKESYPKVDRTSQEQKDAFNTKVDACKRIYEKRQAAIAKYREAIGQ